VTVVIRFLIPGYGKFQIFQSQFNGSYITLGPAHFLENIGICMKGNRTVPCFNKSGSHKIYYVHKQKILLLWGGEKPVITFSSEKGQNSLSYLIKGACLRGIKIFQLTLYRLLFVFYINSFNSTVR